MIKDAPGVEDGGGGVRRCFDSIVVCLFAEIAQLICEHLVSECVCASE